MVTSAYTTLTELSNTTTDIDVASPRDYVDSGPELLPEDTYTVVLKEYELGRDRETGEFKNYIRLRRMQVVDGVHEGRYVNNVTIFTTTFLRKGVRVSGLGDFLRGVDDDAAWSGLREPRSS
jgi:hypothetical protein